MRFSGVEAHYWSLKSSRWSDKGNILISMLVSRFHLYIVSKCECRSYVWTHLILTVMLCWNKNTLWAVVVDCVMSELVLRSQNNVSPPLHDSKTNSSMQVLILLKTDSNCERLLYSFVSIFISILSFHDWGSSCFWFCSSTKLVVCRF